MEIYLITNIINGKVYVGQAKWTAKDRWDQHLSNYRSYLKSKQTTTAFYNALCKYGKESFVITHLAGASSQEELDLLEIKYIAQFKSFPPELGFGYNMTPGGQGGGHYKPHSEKAKNLMSIANKGRKKSKEEREALSKRLKGKSVSIEHRKNLSKANKGKPNPRKGITLSEEVKRNMSMGRLAKSAEISKAALKVWQDRTEEERQTQQDKMHVGLARVRALGLVKPYVLSDKQRLEFAERARLITLGTHRPQEVRDKLRAANLGKVVAEETRQKISVSTKGVLKSTETKAKMSATWKEIWAKRIAEKAVNA